MEQRWDGTKVGWNKGGMKQWGKLQSAAQTGSFLAPARAPADRDKAAGGQTDPNRTMCDFSLPPMRYFEQICLLSILGHGPRFSLDIRSGKVSIVPKASG
jgi:hypothetical protein